MRLEETGNYDGRLGSSGLIPSGPSIARRSMLFKVTLENGLTQRFSNRCVYVARFYLLGGHLAISGETFLIVTVGVGVLRAFSGWRPGLWLDIQPHTG